MCSRSQAKSAPWLRWTLGSSFVAFILGCAAFTSADSLDPEDGITLFPTDAAFDSTRSEWQLPIHGWIYEKELNSAWRSVLIAGLRGAVEPNSPDESERFEERIRWFLVDNARNKKVTIRIDKREAASGPSGPNGHFYSTFRIDASDGGATCPDRWRARVSADKASGDSYEALIHCVEPEGVSVVSDIDDTIKHSNVLDRKELLANTFLHKFKAVDGMSELYRDWADNGWRFHYVSASPWQLYPALQQFIDDERYPPGAFYLKLFRLKDESAANLFMKPEEYKLPVIRDLLRRYPKRNFILVGDNGEHDPEIYGRLAREYPNQVKRILIRSVSGADNTPTRYAAAFAGIEPTLWMVFDSPKQVSIKN